MRIAVCDDEKKYLDNLAEKFAKWSDRISIDASFFGSAAELEAACRTDEFDLAFVDIELGGDNGMKLASRLIELRPQMKIVFITAYIVQYAERIFYDVVPYGFIGKPLSDSKVLFYIERLEKELRRAQNRLAVSVNGIRTEICASDITYIESEKRVAHIYCTTGSIDVYERLDELEKRLDDRFVRCHQSFLVNMEHISGLEGSTFVMKDSSIEPVRISHNRLSDSRRKYFGYVGRSVL